MQAPSFRTLTSVVLAVLLSGALAASGTRTVTPAGLPLAPGPDPYSPAVGRMVELLASYTRWPGGPGPLHLCIIGPADHADALITADYARQTGIVATQVATGSVGQSGCDIAYFGRHPLETQRALAAAVQGQPVLTVAENDPACHSQAMICLLFGADALSFRLNVDAVSRSQLRIDPRVLRMGMEPNI